MLVQLFAVWYIRSLITVATIAYKIAKSNNKNQKLTFPPRPKKQTPQYISNRRPGRYY